MGAKDKAIDLLYKYLDNVGTDDFELKSSHEMAKQCALICVEEILDNIPMYTGNLNLKWKFYNDVKYELIKL